MPDSAVEMEKMPAEGRVSVPAAEQAPAEGGANVPEAVLAPCEGGAPAEPSIHGGDSYGFLLRRGRLPLDFSANVSPLGLPTGVLSAAREALSVSHLYPDPRNRRLREAIARKLSGKALRKPKPEGGLEEASRETASEGGFKEAFRETAPGVLSGRVPEDFHILPEQILCGGGAAELIYRLAWAVRPKTALLAEPTFAEYERALEAAGCRDIRHFLLSEEEDFDPAGSGRLMPAEEAAGKSGAADDPSGCGRRRWFDRNGGTCGEKDVSSGRDRIVRPAKIAEKGAATAREGFLSALTDDVEMVIICNPNNPTGRLWPGGLLRQILARCRRIGALLCIDECFLPFVEEPERESLAEACGIKDRGGLRFGEPGMESLPCALCQTSGGASPARGGLLILRAFTKFYGMAGLRLGFAVSDNVGLLSRMALAGPPWTVSSVAEAAGLAALSEDAYAEKLRTLVREERAYLAEGLGEAGFRVIPGAANFLLFKARASLGEALEEKGILLRSCGNFRGLDETWYRTAVRRREENQRLLEAIRGLL